MAQPNSLSQNYPTTAPNRSFNDFTQLEQQVRDVDQREGYSKAEIDAMMADKADVGDSYTKSEDDTLLSAKANADDLQQEVLARGDADQQLQTNINAKADTTALTEEANTRQQADTTLQNNIDAKADITALNQETLDRQDADQALQNNIEQKASIQSLSDETDARTNADTAIRNDVNAAIGQLNQAIATKQDILTGDNGIEVTADNKVKAKIDGTTIKVNEQGNLYAPNQGGGGGGGTTYTASNGVKIVGTDIQANIDETLNITADGKLHVVGGGGGGTAQWGDITGTLANQQDLRVALEGKAAVGDSYTKSEDDALLANKANSADVYNKTQTDSLLAAKANVGDSYTKAEEEALLDAKEDASNKVTILNDATDDEYPSAKCVADNLLLCEEVANKVTVIQGSATNNQYPSAKAVKDYADTKSVVSGTHDGTNWTKIDINGIQKDIPSGGGVTLQQVYDLIHPVNEIVFGFQEPSTAGVTATWTDISETYQGRYFKVDSTKAVGTSEAEELPTHEHNIVSSEYTVAGCGSSGWRIGVQFRDGGQIFGDRFYASKTPDTIYKNGGAVRPLTTTIKVWQRTA